MKLTIQSFWSGILVSLIAINLYSSQKKSVEELLKYNKSLKHEYLRDECKKETLNIERIQKYLELKANPNKFQSVHALLSFNHKSLSSMHTVLELLIRHNADLTKKDFIWRTPLHCLAENEAISYETLKLLFDNKADPNIKGTEGSHELDHTALHLKPILTSSKAVIELCLEKKANLFLTNGAEETPLNRLCSLEYWNIDSEIVECFLIHKATPNTESVYGTPLYRVLTINNRDHKNNIIGIATLLLQYNADPNWKKRNDDYLLNLIVNQKNSEKGAIKLLLDYKANPCHYSFNHSRDYYLPYQKIEPNKSQYHHDLYFELLLAIPAWIKEKNKPAFETFLLCMHRLKNALKIVPKPLLKEIFFKYMISGHDDIIKVIKKIEHKERTEDKDQKEVDTTIKSFVNRNGY